MRNHVIIIAEAGVNHNGSLDNAKLLIRTAAEAGADYVKFQTFKANRIVSKKAPKAEYQINNLQDRDDSQFQMLKKLEIPEFWYDELIEECRRKGIEFLSTGFDEGSIDFLSAFNPPLYKIPSGEITNKPYLQHIARKGKPIVISTGMADIEEIKLAIEVMQGEGIRQEDIIVLHCNTEYPTPMQDVNLMAMLQIQKELGVRIGYSDHTLGVEVPIAAVALGAMVIEKHFTLDRNLPGPDHAASLEPDELKEMVKAIRNIELAISGSGIKEPSESEAPNKVIARKSIHLSRQKTIGETIEVEDLIMIRPGDGISPMDVEKVIGKRVIFDLEEQTKLKWEYLEK